MKGWMRAGGLLFLLLWISGCMYPNELRKENQLASGEYVLVVQNAIDQYKAKTGVLPIKKQRRNDAAV